MEICYTVALYNNYTRTLTFQKFCQCPQRVDVVKLVTQPARAGGGAGGGGAIDEGVVLTAGWVFWDEA
jgi:hypothetical protein